MISLYSSKIIRKLLANLKTTILQSNSLYHQGIMNSTKKDIHIVDLRSDTFTLPTASMRQAMYSAQVGDDVFEEDPTVKALEKKVATMLDKEAALFVPSGTMGNLIAIMIHCSQRGTELIAGDKSHIFKYEQGGAAQIAGVQVATIHNKLDGTFDLDEMETKIRNPDDEHEPITALICVENTHNVCGGKALPLEWLNELAQRARRLNIPLHLDGARLLNAAVCLDVSPAVLTKDFSTVSLCLSKGLGAPVGSLLLGDRSFIHRARRTRKVLGGGMRQVGILAAAGLVALEEGYSRLADDHAHASIIANGIAKLGSKFIKIDEGSVHTNIIILKVESTKVTAEVLCERLLMVTSKEIEKLGPEAVIVKAWAINNKTMRLVTFNGVTEHDALLVVKKFDFINEELQSQ